MVFDKRPQWLPLIFLGGHVPLLYRPVWWFDLSCLFNSVDTICCCLDHSKSNFGSLIDCVMSSVGKIIPVKESSMLSVMFFVGIFLTRPFSFFVVVFFIFLFFFFWYWRRLTFEIQVFWFYNSKYKGLIFLNFDRFSKRFI